MRVLVLPAVDSLSSIPDESAPWQEHYELETTIDIPGVPRPVRHTSTGLGVVPTGIGKTAAATTTAALCASDRISLDQTLFISVGVAGGPPTLPIGSVVVSETIIDWDDKCRFPSDETCSPPIAVNPYTDRQGIFDLNTTHIEEIRSCAKTVSLATSDAVAEHSNMSSPIVTTGTNVCGDELWHGESLAQQVAWLVDAHDRGPYRATEMEDAGTIAALRRFGYADQYVSIRGIANYDRPVDDTPARDSFFDPGFESGFELGLTNAVRVARAFVDAQLGTTTSR